MMASGCSPSWKEESKGLGDCIVVVIGFLTGTWSVLSTGWPTTLIDAVSYSTTLCGFYLEPLD